MGVLGRLLESILRSLRSGGGTLGVLGRLLEDDEYLWKVPDDGVLVLGALERLRCSFIDGLLAPVFACWTPGWSGQTGPASMQKPPTAGYVFACCVPGWVGKTVPASMRNPPTAGYVFAFLY